MREFAAVIQALSRVLTGLAREIAVFPTALANVLTPVLGLSVSVESRPRARGDIERRIEDITQRLQDGGRDAQTLFVELEQVMEARRQQLMDAQARLLALQLEESEIEERVLALQSVQPEAAVAINALLDESLEARDKRGARRDWLIFGMGVAATALVSLVFYLLTV